MPNADLGNPNFFKTFLGRFEADLPDGGKSPVMLTAMNEVCLMQDLTADADGLLMTLPEKCRPKNPVRFACVVEQPESRKTAVTVSRQVGTVKGSVQDGNSWAARRKGWVKASVQVDTVRASVQTDTVKASRKNGSLTASKYLRSDDAEKIVGSVDTLVQSGTVKASVKTGSKTVNNPSSASSGMTAEGYDDYSTSAVEVPVMGDVNVPVLAKSKADVTGTVSSPVFENVEVPVLSDVEVPVLGSVEVPVMGDVNVPTLDAIAVPLLRDVDIPVLENVTLDLEAGNTPETVVTVEPDGRVRGIPSAVHRLNGRSFYVIDRYYL